MYHRWYQSHRNLVASRCVESTHRGWWVQHTIFSGFCGRSCHLKRAISWVCPELISNSHCTCGLHVWAVRMASVNRCKVSGCRGINSGENTRENGITFFQVPKSSLREWQKLMPTSNLTQTSKICSCHFDENDFSKGLYLLNVFHPYQRWQLKQGALPKHFLTTGNLTVYVITTFC